MKIFVGCSSRDVGNENYNKIAEEIGEWIASNGHDLVFGGCLEGLMGKVYSKVYGRGKVYAIQAKKYEEEVKNLKADYIEVVETINRRKDRYTEIADVLIYIPGGIGTLDEVVTGIEVRRSEEHKKPLIIVNEGNFFGHLLEMLEKIYEENLASISNKEVYYVANSTAEAMQILQGICK